MEMKEANNHNLFATPQNETVLPKTPSTDMAVPIESVSTTKQKETLLDDTTVEVRFCTAGRLSAPPILHFHDYSMLASQALAEIPNSEDILPVIIKVLNSMVVEDFDCGLLHVEEAKEALLSIHAKWWGGKLSNFRYFINPDIEDETKLTAKENISIADIPLSSIAENIVPLDADIKEPINIKSHGATVKFVYPRIRNSSIVSDMLKVKFAVEEQQFARIKQILEYNSKITDPEKKKEVKIEEQENYQKYLAEKARWRIIYTRAQEICGVDQKVFTTFDERVDALLHDGRITVKHWQMYNDFLEGKGSFGIKDEAEFYSDILNKKVTRPFRFYTWSFIPSGTMEHTGDVNDSISFG